MLLVILTFFLKNEIATFVIGPRLPAPSQAAFYFNPPAAEINEGESFNIDIMADTEDQNVVAGSVYVKYDATKLAVQNINPVGSVLNYEVENNTEEENALIKIVRGKPGDGTADDTDDGFTGNRGRIATLSLKALSATAGTSLEFFHTATDNKNVSRLILDDAQGSDILSYVSNAAIKINTPPTPPAPSKIKLKIGLEGRAKYNTSLKAEILDSATGSVIQTYNGQSREDGSVEIGAPSLPPDTYSLRVTVPKYLSVRLPSVSLPDDTTQFTVPTLLSGNLYDGDNIINELDVGALNRKWGTSAPEIDIDQDGIINNTEWVFVNRNWGKTGE